MGAFSRRLKAPISAGKRRKAPSGAEKRRELHCAVFGGINLPETVLDVRRWAVGSALPWRERGR
eukprot:15460946-Alexandrium_andersonii.AAC.1